MAELVVHEVVNWWLLALAVGLLGKRLNCGWVGYLVVKLSILTRGWVFMRCYCCLALLVRKVFSVDIYEVVGIYLWIQWSVSGVNVECCLIVFSRCKSITQHLFQEVSLIQSAAFTLIRVNPCAYSPVDLMSYGVHLIHQFIICRSCISYTFIR